jgi:hypothetical protein
MAGTTLHSRAEVLKLARLLGRSPEELAYLEQIGAEDLRALRDQVTDLLFDSDGAALGRLAAASRLLPIKVAAAIGQRAFGAVLAARITGLLDAGRAVEMAETMPVSFLADVAVELDPRRASAVISGIPPQRIAEITAELLRRREYVAMGRFVGHLSDEALRAAVGVMSDEELLQVGFVLEAKDNLDRLAGILPPQRLENLIQVAERSGMWVEVLDLLSHLGEARRDELAARAIGELAVSETTLRSLLDTALENDLWPDLLPLLPSLPLDLQRRLAAEVARLEPAQREGLERQLRERGMEAQLALVEAARTASG